MFYAAVKKDELCKRSDVCSWGPDPQSRSFRSSWYVCRSPSVVLTQTQIPLSVSLWLLFTTSRIALVDEEIARQKSVLLNLYSHWNSLAFISRLTREIMETIFTHCAHDDPKRFHFHAAPTWVNVSYACHHWRNVGLNYPALWSYHFMV